MSNYKDELNNGELQKVAGGDFSKTVIDIVRLQIPGGNATSAPPIGPALSKNRVDVSKFVNEFNARTKEYEGRILPTTITVYSDCSFSFVTKNPPVATVFTRKKGHDKIKPAPIDKDSFDFLK